MVHTFFFNRPGKHEITDPHELLRNIERKDAYFRVTQTVFFVLLLTLLGILLAFSYRLQSQNNVLLENQHAVLKENLSLSKQLKAGQDTSAARIIDLQNHIDCIVELFQQPNRASLTITNIQSCQLTTSASGGSTGSTKSL